MRNPFHGSIISQEEYMSRYTELAEKKAQNAQYWTSKGGEDFWKKSCPSPRVKKLIKQRTLAKLAREA